MLTTIELARLTAQDRDREAARDGLRHLAQRLAACCRPASLRMRIAAARRAFADACCSPSQERLARSVRAFTGA
ncbi:MAG: hypothetical protein U0838_12590 [Chloroflexota bacterium]